MANSNGKGGVSMLDKMAAMVDTTVAGKVAAAPKRTLTPVSGEAVVSLTPSKPVIPADVPGDLLSREKMAEAVKNLRRDAATMLTIADGLEVLLGVVPAVEAIIAADAETSAKAVEQAADRRAADREKAAAGDKKAEARVNAENPLADLMAVEDARLKARADVIRQAITVAQAADDSATEEDFQTRMARISAEAQAATFKPSAAAPRSAPEESDTGLTSQDTAPAAGGWTCPDHGDEFIEVKVSPRRGVEFRKCMSADCTQFEKV